ncbi:MAG: hypothetical protein E3K37_03990 [Candidatus Kuenenia sp.]|nr:hypothetical protein [Candidatus Kuenenia hertensis]
MIKRCVLGIDGGATKTACLLSDNAGKIIGQGVGGPSNPNLVNSDDIVTAVYEAISGAIRSSSVPEFKIEALCAGIAGVGEEETQHRMRSLICQVIDNFDADTRYKGLFARGMQIEVHTDAIISLVAGTGKRHGIVVISGTGSIIYGERSGDKTARAGGWGNFLDSEGSGYEIGMMALRAIMRAYDGRDHPTLLTEIILKELNCITPAEMVSHVLRKTPAVTEIAGLARLVNVTAKSGDMVAMHILTNAAEELCKGVIAVAKQLSFTKENFSLVLTGGVLRNSDFVEKQLVRKIRQSVPMAIPMVLAEEEAKGAIILALEYTGMAKS